MYGKTIGNFTIQKTIGKGGMGIVYLARQEIPRRNVAIKIINPGITSPKALRRFQMEMQMLGRLRHPNIAQIYEAGTWDEGGGGRPYFAMELLSGAKTITEYARDKKLSIRKKIELFLEVCDAVQYGHTKSVIHRDLKPDNILVGSQGCPKIIDFGVARSTDSDIAVTTLHTEIGAIIGTMQYMSPEQCNADSYDIDARTDVYSLGMMLFEMLCEQTPYNVTKVPIHEAARIVQEVEPIRPSTINRRLRGDLEVITLKAIEKDCDRRYQSAQSLRDDLARYLSGEVIMAKAPTAIDYLRRFAKKHTAAAVTIATIFFILVVAIIAISNFAANAVQAGRIAEEKSIEAISAKKAAQLAEARAVQQAYQANVIAASMAVQTGNAGGIRRRLDAARVAIGKPPVETMPFEWQHLNATRDQALIAWQISEDGLSDLDWSKDGTFAVAGQIAGEIYQIFADPDQQKRLVGHHTGGLRQIDLHPNQQLAASGGEDGTIQIWNLSTAKQSSAFKAHQGAIADIDFSSDGTLIFSSGSDGVIRAWDMESENLEFEFHGHTGRVNDINLAPDGIHIASAGADGTVRVWKISSQKELCLLTGHDSEVRAVNFSTDSETIISAGFDQTIRLWRNFSGTPNAVRDGPECTAILRGHTHWVLDADISDDGNLLASASRDQTVRIWDLRDTTAPPEVLIGHEHEVTSVEFQTGTNRLTSASKDGLVRLWEPAKRRTNMQLKGHDDMTWSVIFTPDGKGLISGSFDQTIKVWDLDLGECMATLRGHTGRVYHVDVSPDGEMIASVSADGTARLWDGLTGILLQELAVSDGLVYMADFNSTGDLLATSGQDDVIRLWDTTTGECVRTLHDDSFDSKSTSDTTRGEAMSIVPGQAEGVRGLAFSPSGDRIASGHGDTLVRIWDTTTGKLIQRCVGHKDGVRAVAWTPDGKLIASGGFDNMVRTWEAETGLPIDKLQGHKAVVRSVSINNAGDRISSGSYDNTIRLWDIENAVELCSLRGNDVYRAVPFSPNDQILAAGSDSGLIHIFTVYNIESIMEARSLSIEQRNRLQPIVDQWMKKAGGDAELIAGLYERNARAGNQYSPSEQAMLRRLVLQALHPAQDLPHQLH